MIITERMMSTKQEILVHNRSPYSVNMLCHSIRSENPVANSGEQKGMHSSIFTYFLSASWLSKLSVLHLKNFTGII
jgi:hypothetical protein